MPWQCIYYQCSKGHRFYDVECVPELGVGARTKDCNECGNASHEISGGAPAIGGQRQRSRRAGEISRGEAVQAAVQFGVTPKNRDELNSLLKTHGKIAVTDKEFDQLAQHRDAVVEANKKRKLSPTQREELVRRIKNRREEFRSKYDHGEIPKSQPVDSDVAHAAAEAKADPLGN